MKKSLFLLLTVLTASPAVAQSEYYSDKKTDIYIDKELTLLSVPLPFRGKNPGIDMFFLFPKKESDQYDEVSKNFVPGLGASLPQNVKGGDMAKILEQAVKHAFPPEQLARIPKEAFLEVGFYWDITGEVYMVVIGLGNEPYFTSIPPANYAKLMRYLKQHVKFVVDPEDQRNRYDWMGIFLEFDTEKLRKYWAGHGQRYEEHKQYRAETRQKIEKFHQNANPRPE